MKAAARLIRAGLLSTVLAVAVSTPPAGATFPGKNGRLAFVYVGPYSPCSEEGCAPPESIMTTDVRGRSLHTLFGPDAFPEPSGPAFSPDGRRIAFARSGIWTVAAHGGRATHMSLTPAFHPAWTPGGRRLVFAGYRSPLDDPDIYSVGRRGEEPRLLVSNADEPAVSSSGELAFVRYVGEPPTPRIHVLGSDGVERTLTNVAGVAPDWSPDGSQIVFERQRLVGGHADPVRSVVCTIGADGLGLRRLAHGEQPVWSPDARKVAFGRLGSLYTMRSDGRNVRPLLRAGHFPQGRGGHGEQLAWQPLPGGQR